MRLAIVVPESMMPRKDPDNPCPCQDRPVEFTVKKGVLSWFYEVGDTVPAGEILCEGEVEKKAVEFPAPRTGVLVEQTVAEDEVFAAGDVLGYLEVEEESETSL